MDDRLGVSVTPVKVKLKQLANWVVMSPKITFPNEVMLRSLFRSPPSPKPKSSQVPFMVIVYSPELA